MITDHNFCYGWWSYNEWNKCVHKKTLDFRFRLVYLYKCTNFMIECMAYNWNDDQHFKNLESEFYIFNVTNLTFSHEQNCNFTK